MLQGKVLLTKQSTLREILNYLQPGSTAITFNREQWLEFKEFYNSLPDHNESGVSVA